MSLVSKLKNLKTNIFGGKGNTGFSKPPASKVQDIDMQPSPTGALKGDPFSFSTMSYPMDVQNNFQNGHYMLFYVNAQNKTKYTYNQSKSIKIKDFEGIKGETDSEARYQKLKAAKRKTYKLQGTGKVDADAALSNRERGRDSTSPKVKKGVSAAFNNTFRITDSVAMYLPPSVEDTTSAGYTDSATGIVGYLAARGGDMIGKDAETIARSLVATGGELLDKAAKKAVSELAEMTTGAEGTEQLINKAFGQADNPYMEVLFDNMQLRTFTYNFQFSPRSEEEAIEVQKIIQLFRFHMAPELRPDVNRFLGLPSQFDIHYMFLTADGVATENNFYNKIATCVLKDCSINYTPGGVKSFEDGGPVETTMKLTFKETELLTKDKIAQGF